MNKTVKHIGLVFAAALALGMGSSAAFGQVGQGYWGASGGYVKNATGLCWHAGYWTPAMATMECDPDLVPKPAPAPAPAPTRAPVCASFSQPQTKASPRPVTATVKIVTNLLAILNLH